jgi:hypothetical protein
MAQLVGRAREMSQALAALRHTAQRGDSAVLLVTGEAVQLANAFDGSRCSPGPGGHLF